MAAGERFLETGTAAAGGGGGAAGPHYGAHHNRSTSSRWHRKQGNPHQHYLPRTVSNQNPALPPRSTSVYLPRGGEPSAPPVPGIYPQLLTYAPPFVAELPPHGEADGVLDETQPRAPAKPEFAIEQPVIVPAPFVPAAVRRLVAPPPAHLSDPSNSMRIQPEWEWCCIHARMKRCSLVDGVVCDPPDIGVIVGVPLENEDRLRALERCEYDVCDSAVNIRKSLNADYNE